MDGNDEFIAVAKVEIVALNNLVEISMMLSESQCDDGYAIVMIDGHYLFSFSLTLVDSLDTLAVRQI
jgi:hypothetical protein